MSSYLERQKSLNEHLKEAEDQHSFSKTNKATEQDYGEIDRRTYKRLKQEMKQFRNKESIFKRPEAKLRDCVRNKTIPDYMKNPQKWNYYSLSDVTPDQLSDATNTATALAFIREMESKEEKNIEMLHDADDCLFKKPTFHISVKVKKQASLEENKSVFKQNKLVMPEVIVGVSKPKNTKNKILVKKDSSTDNAKRLNVKLLHLLDEEDDD